MFGDNPQRGPINGEGKTLFVKNIFKTLQGEGPHVGMPAIFVRLGGCNLACSFCDTEFEDFSELNVDQIGTQVSSLSKNSDGKKVVFLVVISGGEPMRQPVEFLCQTLIDLGFKIQIETNGTIVRTLPNEVEIICSPKVVNGKYHSVRSDLLVNITAFKFLISENIVGYDSVPELGQLEYKIPVFIQPMDQYDLSVNEKNKNLALKLVLEFGYRLSIQTHKIIGIE